MKTDNGKDGDVTLLGSPGYEEYIENQGQQAMDRALAMPLVRVFFGLMCLCFAVCIFAGIGSLGARIAERQWWDILADIGLVFGSVLMLLESGSICLFGRSRTPWYRAIVRAYKATR